MEHIVVKTEDGTLKFPEGLGSCFCQLKPPKKMCQEVEVDTIMIDKIR